MQRTTVEITTISVFQFIKDYRLGMPKWKCVEEERESGSDGEGGEVVSIQCEILCMFTDIPTFYQIKAEDFPLFLAKKPRKIFLLGKYSDIFICR